MDPNSLDLGSSDHVVDVIEEQECNIPSQEICLEKEINDASETTSADTATQEPAETTDASETNSVESPTCEADRSLLGDEESEYTEFCLRLWEAASSGDWEAVLKDIRERRDLVRFAITKNGDLMLHIAVKPKATKQGGNFVAKLVKKMHKEELEIVNDSGEPAYMIAAESGNVDMVREMVKKHKDLLSKFPWQTLIALQRSAQNGNNVMALYLYDELEETHPSFWTDAERCLFLKYCIEGNLVAIALKVLERHSKIVRTSKKICFAILDALARRPDLINRTESADSILPFFHVKKNSPEMDNQALKLVQSLLKLYNKNSLEEDDILGGRSIQIDGKEVLEEDISSHGLLLTAAEMDNTRFVIEFLRVFPKDANNAKKEGGISIFHIAIKRRNTDIYNLSYETGSHKPLTMWRDDKTGNNILHYFAMSSKDTAQLQTVSGASLLMQRELLWYKELKKSVPPWYRKAQNKDGKTPCEIFLENNKELVSKGLNGTRDCMVVATLIITVAFAVAFTHPGGYNQETGIPIFERHRSFLVFLIADSISFIASSTSLLVFLSILTSRHGQHDFLYAMPGKLMIGLVTLFMSVAAMMVTFSASFFVLYQNTNKWLAILTSVFAAIPVIIYAALQYPFVMDMFRSTYDSRYLFDPERRVLFNLRSNRTTSIKVRGPNPEIIEPPPPATTTVPAYHLQPPPTLTNPSIGGDGPTDAPTAILRGGGFVSNENTSTTNPPPMPLPPTTTVGDPPPPGSNPGSVHANPFQFPGSVDVVKDNSEKNNNGEPNDEVDSHIVAEEMEATTATNSNVAGPSSTNQDDLGFQQPKKRNRRSKKDKSTGGIVIPKPKVQYISKKTDYHVDPKGKAQMTTLETTASSNSSQPVRMSSPEVPVSAPSTSHQDQDKAAKSNAPGDADEAELKSGNNNDKISCL